MIENVTEGEFLRFSERYRNKLGARLLRLFYEKKEPRLLVLYRRVEEWSGLPRLPEEDFNTFSDRYHMHLEKAKITLKEHDLLFPAFHKMDHASEAPCLDVAIYLDNLRSAFNVGSILRTTEAFRLGKVCFGKTTPYIDNLKVQKTSMCTHDKVVCERVGSFADLPRPLIAMETAEDAPSIFDFEFPETFTLMLGNEEYGLSEEALSQRDAIVRIPLYGFKNSLNVASAFAIAAGVISHQLRNRY